jgi:hypothetical protein
MTATAQMVGNSAARVLEAFPPESGEAFFVRRWAMHKSITDGMAPPTGGAALILSRHPD